MSPNASDWLRYYAKRLDQTYTWTGDSISGSDRGGDHELELDALHDLQREMVEFANDPQFGPPNQYSDGRIIYSSCWIVENGLSTGHLWYPDPAQEKPQSWSSALPSDPGIPSPGRYTVTTDPATQQIHVRVLRGAA